MSMLFPQEERNDQGGARHGEGQYEYLQRSARTAAEKVRSVLEEWFARYPESEQEELLCRFQSDDAGFMPAFFELYLHEILIRLNLEVQVHPELGEGISTKPDFFVEGDKEEDQFYLEASVVTGRTEEEKGQLKTKQRVYEWIEELDSPDFFIGVHVESSSNTTPRKKTLLADLKNWIESLVWGDVLQAWETVEGSDEFDHEFIDQGWRIEFHAIPKLDEERGKQGVNPIGSLMETRFMDRRDSVRKRIIQKGRRYKAEDAPYIIAVNCMDFRSIEGSIDPITEALFGEQVMVFLRNPESINFSLRRKMDGAWTSEDGPRYTRISAVMFGFAIDPWNMASQDLLLVENPWAQYPANKILMPMQRLTSHLAGNDVELHRKKGTHPLEILGLPEGWPE